MMTPIQGTEHGDGTEPGLAVALRVRGRLCIVVGGGQVGERKTVELLEVGAQVRVVSPQMTAALAQLLASECIEYRSQPFAPRDLEGAFLVVAATDSPEVNQSVLEAAAKAGILANRAGAVTSGASGDFDTMATVRRGDLLIGITTGGAGPALAARIKAEIASRWGAEYAPWTALLRIIRKQAQGQVWDRGQRTDFLRRLAARDDLRVRIADGDLTGARAEAEQMLNDIVERQAACPAR